MNPKKILIIRFSSLGDLILLTPLFREVKKLFPQAKLDLLTSVNFADVCKNNPHLDSIIKLDRKEKGSGEINRILKICKETDYDLVLDAHRSLRSKLILLKWFGIKNFFSSRIKRIDKRNWQRNLLLTFKINLLKKYRPQRREYCRLINDFTELDQLDFSTELFPSAQETQNVDQIFEKNNLAKEELIAFGPSAAFTGKCWPKEYYLKLIEKLQNQGKKIVLLGGSTDPETVWIYQNLQQKPLNLAGKLSFLESAEFLKRCKLAITNDSAIVHFAEAMKCPVIAIFGPTSKEFGFAPFLEKSYLMDVELPCRPCSRNGKDKCKNKIDHECLHKISVERVLSQALKILN